jgi:4-hydroxyphenylpyruvate dioxygenase-like putative hemolysin
MSATVLQINGRSYVDVETLVQITSGSVKFEANQIVLTIPVANADSASAQSAPGLSKEFASAAIEAVAEMKEWKGALGTMVTYGLAVDGTWAQTYQDRVRTSLGQATVAASTNSDHSALQLLTTQFAHLANWENEFIAERKALNGARTVDPNALQTDPALVKISSCGRFLSTMLVSRVFADNANCD